MADIRSEVYFYMHWPIGIQALCLCSQVGLYWEVTPNTGLIVPCYCLNNVCHSESFMF